MYALDFEYDGQHLSDYGFIICDFNSPSGADIVNAGSKIVFNTVSNHKGKIRYSVGTQYDECIQTTFDICKNPDLYQPSDMEISNDEFRDLVRWLNRKQFLKFQVVVEDALEHSPCYFDASFNIDKIEIHKKLFGLRLTMETNRPFGYGEREQYLKTIIHAGEEFEIIDRSDEIGYIYPDITVICNAGGNLRIQNLTNGTLMEILNCTEGETITIQGNEQILVSSDSAHEIYNDFNFHFLRIENSLGDRSNIISVSLPCIIDIQYDPIIKDVP